MSTVTTDTGHYVYAFIRAEDAPAVEAQQLVGLNEQPIVVVQAGQLAVVTSAIPAQKIRPRRQLLAAHQKIVTEVSRSWDMLPVSFGLIADSNEDLTSLFEGNQEVLLEKLERIGGQVEMNLILSWNTDNVFAFFVQQHAELQQARDYIASGEASRDEMIELGRKFEQLLESERASHAEKVAAAMTSVCSDTELQTPKNENEVVRLNCLLPRDGEEAFTQALHKIASEYDENFAFNFNGPWPPYSFVKLTLSPE